MSEFEVVDSGQLSQNLMGWWGGGWCSLCHVPLMWPLLVGYGVLWTNENAWSGSETDLPREFGVCGYHSQSPWVRPYFLGLKLPYGSGCNQKMCLGCWWIGIAGHLNGMNGTVKLEVRIALDHPGCTTIMLMKGEGGWECIAGTHWSPLSQHCAVKV